MRKTINIDFDNSSSVLLAREPDILGGTSTKYAYSTHTHGAVSGINLTCVSSASDGLTLSVAPPSAASNSLYVTGPYLTRSTLGISTTLGVTGVQSAGAYITTAALSDHVHGGAPSISGQIAGTISENAWSLSIPDFVLTQNASAHSHDYAGTGTTVGATAGTLVKMTLNNAGLNMSVPNFLTTAAQISHTHGVFQGTNITAVSSGSAGLALSVAPKMGTVTTIVTTDGSVPSGSGGTAGLSLTLPIVPKGSVAFQDSNGVSFGQSTTGLSTTVTASVAQSFNSDAIQLSGFSSSSIHASGIPYGLSLTASPGGNNITLAGNVTSAGAGYILISSGTATIAGGDNITLSQDGNAFTIKGAASGTDAGIAFSMSTSNTSGAKSLVSTGTLYFEGGPAITLSQTSNSINIVGNTSTVGFGTSSTSTGGVDLKMTVNTDGISFGVPAWITNATVSASNSVYAGAYVSLSTENVATTVSVTGLVDVTSPRIQQVNIGSNTSGTTADISSGSMVLAGGNNITLIQDANSITISGASIHAQQTGISGIADSAATITNGTVQFSNINGISFGLAGSTLTASYASDAYIGTAYSDFYQATTDNSLSMVVGYSTHTHGSISTGSTTGYDIKFTSSSSGMTVGFPVLSTLASATHTHGSIFTSSITGSDIKNSSAQSGLTLSIPPYAVTSHTHSNLYAGLAHTHGAGSLATTNIAGTISSTSNAWTLSLSYPASTNFLNTSQSGNIYFQNGSGVTFGSTYSSLSTTVTGSIDSGNVYFVNSLGANLTWSSSTSGNSTWIGAIAGGGTGVQGYELEGANTAGTTSLSLGSQLYLSGGDNITISGNSNTIVFSAGGGTGGGIMSYTLGGNTNTGGTNQLTGTYMQLIGGQNITLSGYSSTNLRIDAPPSGTMSLINTNGVSFVSSSAGSTTSISASVETAYVPLANSTKFATGWSLSSSTGGSVVAGTTSSSMMSGSVLRLVAGSNITLSGNTYGVQIIGKDVPLFGIAGSGTGTFTSGTLYFSNANGLSFGLNASTMTASINNGIVGMGNTASSNAFTSGSVMISGANLTVNTSSAGASQYLQISAPAIGYLFFSNTNGHSWGSSVDGVSTSIYIST